MKKVIIGIVVLLIVVAVGAGSFVFLRNDSSEDQKGDENPFAPALTDGEALTATITATTKKGNKTVTVMKHDGQGNSEYTIGGTSNSRVVFTDDFYYSCSKGSCLKFSKDSGNTFNTDPGAYDMSQTDVNKIRENVTHEGQKPCPSGGGTCEVYTTTKLTSDGGTATIYMDSATKKIVQTSIEDSEGVKTKIVYEYGAVTVDVPKNAKEQNYEIPSNFIEE